MKQQSLFENEDSNREEGIYTSKIKAPIYEPSNTKPHILELCDDSKTKRLIREIELSDIDNEIKDFLIKAAYRHNKFNYQKIADFYASSNKEVQVLFEKSALVIIDFGSAFENGYVKLSHEISNQYFNNYGEE